MEKALPDSELAADNLCLELLKCLKKRRKTSYVAGEPDHAASRAHQEPKHTPSAEAAGAVWSEAT
jgi:hypothetical protein